MTRRPTPPHRHIYVIGPPVGLQKVGIATDPKARLATLQTAVPFDLLLHLAVPVPFDDAAVIERRAHRLLAKSCVRNEWFEASPAEAIAAVQLAVTPRQLAKPAAPTEWRLSPAERKPVQAPDVAPLVEAGRQFRPTAAFHRPVTPAPLPLFDYVPPIRGDEQALVDRVLDAVMRRMGQR